MRRGIIVILVLLCTLAPTPARAEDAPIGWLVIPSIALYAPIHTAPIVDTMHQISSGVDHLQGTTWPDDAWGRVVLAAHNPGAFGHVPDLQPGARIIVVTYADVYEFEVVTMTIVTNDVRLLAPTRDYTLTLLTCMDRGITWLAVDAKAVR